MAAFRGRTAMDEGTASPSNALTAEQAAALLRQQDTLQTEAAALLAQLDLLQQLRELEQSACG
jgi:hypothetical protein